MCPRAKYVGGAAKRPNMGNLIHNGTAAIKLTAASTNTICSVSIQANILNIA